MIVMVTSISWRHSFLSSILLQKFTRIYVLILCKELLLGGRALCYTCSSCCKLLVLSAGIPLMAHKICFAWVAENTESTGWEDWTIEFCHRWNFFSASVRGGPKWSSCELWWNWSCHMRLLLLLWCHGTIGHITVCSLKISLVQNLFWISCNIFLFLLSNKQTGMLYGRTDDVRMQREFERTAHD